MKQNAETLKKQIADYEYYLRNMIYYYYMKNDNDKMEVADNMYYKYIEFFGLTDKYE